MTLYLSTAVLEVADMGRAVAFWTQALGYVTSYESPEYTALKHPKDPARFRIGFQPQEGGKREVNRVHLDLATDDKEREAKRLEGLGATRVPDWEYGTDEPNWLVMRDPDGNEFCLVQYPKEKLLHTG
jgi:predicted enzyme related to lactoylglutathione lyase